MTGGTPCLGRAPRRVALAAGVVCGGLLLSLGRRPSQAWYDYDCTDFDTREDAQAFYEEAGGPVYDPFNLDDDDDGVACEEWARGYEQISAGEGWHQRAGRHRPRLRRFREPGRGAAYSCSKAARRGQRRSSGPEPQRRRLRTGRAGVSVPQRRSCMRHEEHPRGKRGLWLRSGWHFSTRVILGGAEDRGPGGGRERVKCSLRSFTWDNWNRHVPDLSAPFLTGLFVWGSQGGLSACMGV